MLYVLEPQFSCLEILSSYYLTEWIATTTRSEENVGEGECNIARFFLCYKSSFTDRGKSVAVSECKLDLIHVSCSLLGLALQQVKSDWVTLD